MRGRRPARHRGGGLGPGGRLFRPVLDPTRLATRACSTRPLELLVRGGRHVCHAMAMVVPEAWEEARDLDPEVLRLRPRTTPR